MNKQKFSTSSEISELWRGQSMELLKELHILTRDGKINADSRRKLKQVYHLTQLIEPLIQKLYAESTDADGGPRIVDMGAGKSYLGFILYDLILRNFSTGTMVSIESRPELIEKSRELARVSGFERMRFIEGSIADVSKSDAVAGPIHMVCALHACDTATDDAILFGLKNKAQYMVIVPCCQAELAKQLESIRGTGTSGAAGDLDALASLWRFPLHRREFASHLTNVLRVLFLESKGYKVTVTELIGWEHSLKNELILAEYIGKPNERSLTQMNELLEKIKVKPAMMGTS